MHTPDKPFLLKNPCMVKKIYILWQAVTFQFILKVVSCLINIFCRQCTEALGGRDFQEVQQLVKAGTLTEEELRYIQNFVHTDY